MNRAARSVRSRRTKPASTDAERFDARYYDRYYGDAATRVSGLGETKKLARFVAGYLDYMGVPVRRVLDAGCGLGRWKHALGEHYPRARYTGLEWSEHLCARYGWEQGSIASYRGRGRYDLVVCQGVLQYLGDADAARAIDNLARLCRGALYLEVLTREDWRDACDQRATDGAVYRRPAAFYRERLARHFIAVGGGVFVPKDGDVVLYALERCE
jgi:SAM-dependent methyltransferase